jgi:hypothetical protein
MVTVTDDLILADASRSTALLLCGLCDNEEPHPIDENDPSAQRLSTPSGVVPVEVDLRRDSKGTDCKHRGDTALREL